CRCSTGRRASRASTTARTRYTRWWWRGGSWQGSRVRGRWDRRRGSRDARQGRPSGVPQRHADLFIVDLHRHPAILAELWGAAAPRLRVDGPAVQRTAQAAVGERRASQGANRRTGDRERPDLAFDLGDNVVTAGRLERDHRVLGKVGT